MIRQGKVWGWTKPLHVSESSEIHEVKIRKDGFCSRHSHKHKVNQFYVFAGKLKIIIWKDYGSSVLEDTTILGPGESCIVPAGEDHRFEALEDTHALEIYYVKLNTADILRVDHGGVFDAETTAKPDEVTGTGEGKLNITPKPSGWPALDDSYIVGSRFSHSDS